MQNNPGILPIAAPRSPAVVQTVTFLDTLALETYQNGDCKIGQITSHRLENLYSRNVILKIWKIATEHLARKVRAPTDSLTTA